MKIFLSVSFSSQVDAKGVVNKSFRRDLETVISELEEDGHEIFCAPRLEGWKIADHDPAHALKTDLNALDETDVYVAILSDKPSTGVQLETGYALARGKRIVLASPSGVPLSWTNNALAGFENVSNVNFELYDELARHILDLIKR